MTPVEDYIEAQPNRQRGIMKVLHLMIMANDRISAKIRFRIPFYYQKSWVCYLNPIKGEGVELCFTRANELSNTDSVLDFKDRKQVAGISYFSVEDIDEPTFHQVLQEALLLDETVKYASKRKK